MDLSDEILDYELYATIGMNENRIEVGSMIPVRREHIARDPSAAPNRIVTCKVIAIEKHALTGKVALQIQADGYAKKPFISISQIENCWDDMRVHESPLRNMSDSFPATTWNIAGNDNR